MESEAELAVANAPAVAEQTHDEGAQQEEGAPPSPPPPSPELEPEPEPLPEESGVTIPEAVAGGSDPLESDKGSAAAATPLPSAADFCGEGTGISAAGIRHCLARFGLTEAQPIENEFIVDTPSDAEDRRVWTGLSYRKSAIWNDRAMTTEARNGTRVTAVSQTDTWIQVERGHWLPKQVGCRQFLKPALAIDVDTTTSDLCHAFIKPATLPRGWVDEPELLHDAGAAAGVVVDDIQGCHRDDGPHGDASVTVG
jgi:hypothetical protein